MRWYIGTSMHELTVAAILFGRAGSSGVPDKNVREIAGLPCCAHPLRAARDTGVIQHLYVHTDDPRIADIGREYGAKWLKRPSWLVEPVHGLEDCVRHAYAEIGRLKGRCPELFVILQANAPCITRDALVEAIALMLLDSHLDSVITGYEASNFHPSRARYLENGRLRPVVPVDDASKGDRKEHPPVYFGDGGAVVVRREVLHALETQPPPFRWHGSAVGFVEQPASTGDIDYTWQLPLVEQWLLRT